MKELWNRGIASAKQWSTSTLVRQYTSNTGWMMATRAAWILSALTVGIYVARQLGPYNFGVFNYAIALTGIFSIIMGEIGGHDAASCPPISPEDRQKGAGDRR